MKKFTIISLMIVFCSVWCHSQMTLNDCLVYAREHAHKNNINRVGVERAGVEARQAASSLMPDLQFSSGGNLSFGRNIDPETNTYDNKQTLSTSFGLYMSIPLFDGLVSVNNLKAARVARKRVAMDSQADEDEVSLSVISSYYNVFYCKAIVAQMESQLERDSRDCSATMRGYELGTKSGADVAEIKALVASDRYELTNQRNLLSKAWLKLRGDMGMELSADSLYIVEEEVVAYGSIEKNPRLASAELLVRERELYLRSAKGTFSPRLTMNGGVSTSYYKMMGTDMVYPDFSRQWRDNMGQYVGLSLSIPLFSGLSKVNAVKKASLNLLESRLRLEQTQYELEKQTAEARLDLESASEGLESALERLNAEQKAYEAVHRKYELGSASAIDLYSAGAKLAKARAELEGKRIQRIVSDITLRYCLGEKLIK